ncbi:MAG: hypothetical protein ACYC4L_05695 [Chloroflexota bacterium]
MNVGLGARLLAVRRERVLPFVGEVVATRGRVVRADDIVARGVRPRHPFALPVAAMLGEQERNVAELLLKRPGAEIAAGELVAVKKGLFGRVSAACHCPEAGTVLEFRASDGLLIIRPKGDDVGVAAGITGKVVNVLPERGVVIETPALHCQGLALAGAETWGTLRAGADQPYGKLAPDGDCAGSLLFAGSADLVALEQARKAGAAAVIVGSVNADAWQAAQSDQLLGLSLLVVECFGDAPLAERSFDLLREAVGRPAFIGRGIDLGQAPVRPELIVSLNTWSNQVQPPTPRLEVGAEVRLAVGPRAGHWGRVSALDLRLTEHPCSIGAGAAEVILTDGAVLLVSPANLELVG